MDPLEHTPAGGGLLWYGEANLVQQAYRVVRQRDKAAAQNILLEIVAGTTSFQQFTIFIVLDEQMRQDDDIPGAKKINNLLKSIR